MASHREIAHRWAQMNRNLSLRGFNMYAEGLRIYSYGSHFEIARWVPTTPRAASADVPAMVVLFNSEGYSVSTAKHKSFTRSAIRGSAEVFTLPTPFWPINGGGNGSDAARRKANAHTAKEALKYFETQALECFDKASRARTYAAMHLEDAERRLRDAERFAVCFGVTYVRPAVDELRAKAERQAKASEAARKAADKARRKADAAKREQERADFEAWQRGETHWVPQRWQRDDNGAAYIRRSPDGTELQTSMGASVPWEHAVKAFRFMRLCRERGEGWNTNGRIIRVGHFQVSSIDAEGNMIAGCHSFRWSAAEALAKAYGVFDLAPSADALEAR